MGALLLTSCARDRSQVWFAPNLGSLDMVDLFTRPDEWTTARQSTDVFKFYGRQLLAETPTDCPLCGPNILPAFDDAQAFSQLRGWGISTAIEVGVIKEFDCAADTSAVLAERAIRNVQLGGGDIAYLAMDEPILGAETCQLSVDQAAREVAAFSRAVHQAYPAVRIGEIVPYPHFDVVKITAWLAALRQAGFVPAFVHLDVDRVAASLGGYDIPTDIRTLQKVVELQNLPFGVIFWGADNTDEAAYAADVLSWVETVRQAIGQPGQSIFQSWSVAADGRFVVPRNLPETDPETMTHTRLLDEGLRVLRSRQS